MGAGRGPAHRAPPVGPRWTGLHPLPRRRRPRSVRPRRAGPFLPGGRRSQRRPALPLAGGGPGPPHLAGAPRDPRPPPQRGHVLPVPAPGPCPAMRAKGRVQPGSDADLTVFDPERVSDRATYTDPLVASTGITHVMVGGALVVRDGEVVPDALPGKPLFGGKEPA